MPIPRRLERLEKTHKDTDFDLLPCPCCGGQARLSFREAGVYCVKCGLMTGAKLTTTIAVAVWNRRIFQPKAEEAGGEIVI